jgi:hypothetical protein
VRLHPQFDYRQGAILSAPIDRNKFLYEKPKEKHELLCFDEGFQRNVLLLCCQSDLRSDLVR